MLREMLIGAAAGAAGTTALNAVTYGDMLVRGRPASGAPSEAAARLAEKAGIDLSAEGEAPDGYTAQNRRSGLGALLGFFPGLGVGVAYGVVRPRLGEVSTLRAGAVLGLAAMVASDGPMVALGVTDPRRWNLNSWLSDIIPHVAYGLATAAAYEACTG
ncbi:MAG: hypothetical protein M3R38_00020 [Actinomycetota bacterium]|nr:hypothetical protein [Actinomycetota bacterium]